MENVVLAASQVVVIATAGSLAVALVVAALRRRRTARVPWLPTVATVVLLLGTSVLGFVAIGPGLTPVAVWAGASWFIAWPVIASTYPDGRFVPRWTIAPVLVMVGVTLVYLVTGGAITGHPLWLLVPWSASALFFGVGLYRYLRRLSVSERAQARWFVLGAIIEVEAFVLLMAVSSGGVAGGGPLSVAAANLAGLPIGVGLALGILKPGMLDVDRALRAVIAFTVGAVPLAVVFGGLHWVVLAGGGSAESAAWVGAVAVALVAIPLYRIAPRLADLLVYRGRADSASSLRELSHRLDNQLEPARVPSTIVELVAESLALEGVELSIRGMPIERSGELSDVTEDFPLDYQGERLGTLRVSPRRAEAALDPRDRATLLELSRYAAPALHGAKAYADLVDARVRVVLAREEERKQLRRDLHDDLAPALVGISLGAAAVAKLAKTGEQDLDDVAEQLQADVQAALAQTRELAHGLRPALLDDQGLVATIRHRLRGPDGERPVITVTAPDHVLDLPAAVELAVLRIVQEAVSNVRRHASAEHCSVILTVDGDILAMEIIDDGVGLSVRHVPGLGLASIRERAEELGGSARARRGPAGGTRVSVILPFAAPLTESLRVAS